MTEENLNTIIRLQEDVAYEAAMKEQYRRDVLILDAWIKKNSTCKTCFGHRNNTMGGIPCKECGLEGTQPWGG